MTAQDDAGRRSTRSTALAACLLGSVVAVTAAGRVWLRVREAATPGLPALARALTAADVAGGVRALAVLGLASVAALLATRGRARQVVGVVVLLAGVGITVASVHAAVTPPGAVVGRPATQGIVAVGAAETYGRTAWPWVCAAGGLLLAAGGVLAARDGGGWPALSRRYDAPSGPAGPGGDRGLWDAIDRGEDPTG